MEQEDAPRKVAKAQVKKYETRTIKGTVIDAATGNPVSGAIVKASGGGLQYPYRRQGGLYP